MRVAASSLAVGRRASRAAGHDVIDERGRRGELFVAVLDLVRRPREHDRAIMARYGEGLS